MVSWAFFDYRNLVLAGWASLDTGRVNLLITLRGRCMIDAFNIPDQRHIAYLDFDIKRDLILDSTYGSPFIGLPFPRPSAGAPVELRIPFEDLRGKHTYGFFIDPAYRNKGGKDLWNLDELLLSVALEVAHEAGIRQFTIRPTGDTASYYRYKFFAKVCQTTGSDRFMAIDLSHRLDRQSRLYRVQKDGKTRFFRVKTSPD